MVISYKIVLFSSSLRKSIFIDRFSFLRDLYNIEFIDSSAHSINSLVQHDFDQWIIHIDDNFADMEVFIESFCSSLPAVQPLLLFTNINKEFVLKMANRGLCGFTVLEDEPRTLLKALSQLEKYGSYIHPLLTDIFLDFINDKTSHVQSKKANRLLTDREQSVLRHLAKGRTQKEIANVLDVTPHTIASHLKNAYRKIGVRNKGEAILYAFQEGILDLEHNLENSS